MECFLFVKSQHVDVCTIGYNTDAVEVLWSDCHFCVVVVNGDVLCMASAAEGECTCDGNAFLHVFIDVILSLDEKGCRKIKC